MRITFGIDVEGSEAEWSIEDAYLPLPRPGGDAWLRIGVDGAAEYEATSRGAISWLNDLHKGRNTGPVWSWFIDIFALASLVFSVTGFLILKLHYCALVGQDLLILLGTQHGARRRPPQRAAQPRPEHPAPAGTRRRLRGAGWADLA